MRNARHFQVLLANSQPLSANVSRLFDEVLAGQHSPADASIALRSPSVLRELKYLYVNNFTPPDAWLERYRQLMERMSTPAAAVAVTS